MDRCASDGFCRSDGIADGATVALVLIGLRVFGTFPTFTSSSRPQRKDITSSVLWPDSDTVPKDQNA